MKKKQVDYLLISLTLCVLMVVVLAACAERERAPEQPWTVSEGAIAKTAIVRLTQTPSTNEVNLPVETIPVQPLETPTPDEPHQLPEARTEPEPYIVRPSDTLFAIAKRHHVGVQAIIRENDLDNPNLLEVGQVLMIPKPEMGPLGSGFKIIPNGLLVYGPASVGFDIEAFIESQNGYLASYSEEVDQEMMTGAAIVARVAQEFSVGPRLLLAVLEHRSGWVTQSQPAEETLEFPITSANDWRTGLYLQLGYAADNLNRGYYLWDAGAAAYWVLADEQIAPIDPGINAGTAGVQHFYASLLPRRDWDQTVGEQGLYATFNSFFGFPFSLAVDLIVPDSTVQPDMQLPFETGLAWSFTGGPHGGWGNGSAWAGLDFAPPGEPLGCIQSDMWVVAVADGRIVRSDNGAVVQDLDMAGPESNDGREQTGWTVLYMHIESRERVPVGAYLKAGDRIGHPSCEGGISTGTHLHLARRYNGEWIAADGNLPFVLDGWVSEGAGVEYDGYLRNGSQVVEAWEGNVDINKIGR